MFGKAKEKAQRVADAGRKVAGGARTAKDIGAMLLTRTGRAALNGAAPLSGDDAECRRGHDLNKVLSGKATAARCCTEKLEAVFSEDDD